MVTIAEAGARRLGRMAGPSRQALVAFLRSPRYEVLPTDDVEQRVLATVPHEVTITSRHRPAGASRRRSSWPSGSADHGYQVVPHISARLIRDDAHLREVLGRVAAIGRREIFVVAGDAKEPAGQFPDSVSLLAALTADRHGMREIGVTGYPERHSFIDDDLTIQAMWDKRHIATYIVSNLCFDPRVVKKWVARVRRRGVQLPIYVGLAGVADPAKLLRISTRIGVVDSARFLRGHSNWFLRMVQPGGYDPGRFIDRLAAGAGAPRPQGSRPSRVHVQRDRADRALAPGDPGPPRGGLKGGRFMAVTFPTDLEIARQAHLLPMPDIAAKMGIGPHLLEPYGYDVAKIRLEAIDELASQAEGQVRGRFRGHANSAGRGQDDDDSGPRTGADTTSASARQWPSGSHRWDRRSASRAVRPAAVTARSCRWSA